MTHECLQFAQPDTDYQSFFIRPRFLDVIGRCALQPDPGLNGSPAATERRSTSCCGETGEPCVAARSAMMSSMSATTTSAPMARG
jgi:hypothetical protein